MKQKFNVTGMTCSACSAHVEKAVSKVEGVSSVNVNLLGNSMLVEYDEGKTGSDAIIAAVVEGGYGASLPSARTSAAPAARTEGANMGEELAHMKRRFLISLCFLIPLFYLAMGHMMGWPLPALLPRGSENAVSYRPDSSFCWRCRSCTSTTSTTRWASRPCSSAPPTWTP